MVALGILLVIFEAVGTRLEFLLFFRDSLGAPRLRQPTQWRVTGPSRGQQVYYLQTVWAGPFQTR